MPSVLNLKPNYSVCWTGAEVSLLSFLTMKQRTCILQKGLCGHFIPWVEK